MGGTSFDVCVIKDGEIPTTSESWVGRARGDQDGRRPPSAPAAARIAWIDSLGLLRVGPAERRRGSRARPATARAARADRDRRGPGARLHPGRLLPRRRHQARRGGSRRGGRAGGRAAGHERAEPTAQAMFTTINTVMANLITEVCTKKGHDVRDFTLVAGGGAGGMHAAASPSSWHSHGDRAAGGGADERLRHVRHGHRARLCAFLLAAPETLDLARVNRLYADMEAEATPPSARIGPRRCPSTQRRDALRRPVPRGRDGCRAWLA